MKMRSTILPALAVALAACGGHGTMDPGSAARAGDGRESEAAFQTDSLRYTLVRAPLGVETVLRFTFSNPTDAPVFIVNCNGHTEVWLEKLVEGEWLRSWSPAIPDCLSPPIVVEAAATWSSSIQVFSGYPSGNVYPRFEVDPIPGVYRLAFGNVLQDYDARRYPFGQPLPLERRVSNRFELEVAQHSIRRSSSPPREPATERASSSGE